MTLKEISKAIEDNTLTNPQIVFERTVEACVEMLYESARKQRDAAGLAQGKIPHLELALLTKADALCDAAIQIIHDGGLKK